MVQVLKDIKVVEHGTFITGPFAGMMLADVGGEVIVIDRAGDVAGAAKYPRAATDRGQPGDQVAPRGVYVGVQHMGPTGGHIAQRIRNRTGKQVERRPGGGGHIERFEPRDLLADIADCGKAAGLRQESNRIARTLGELGDGHSRRERLVTKACLHIGGILAVEEQAVHRGQEQEKRQRQ